MQLDASVAAFVTGGASGLGAATARRLAGHGVKVALFDLNTELGERVAGEIGGLFCPVDVTSNAEVEAGFARARDLIGQERILVNCAGTGNAFKTPGRDRESGEIALSARRFRTDHSDQPDRYVPLHRQKRRWHADFAAARRRRARRDRQHRLGGSRRRASGLGRLLGFEGGRRRSHTAGGARFDGRWHPRQYHPSRHL